jgi:hypothetical protein
VNNAEKNRAYICKSLDGKPLFSAFYGMYTVTLNELKVVLKVIAQAEQSGAVKSTAQDDDFHEVKRCKKHISNDSHRYPTSRLNKSQHPQLLSCLKNQC